MTDEEWVNFESKNRSRALCYYRGSWCGISTLNTLCCQWCGGALVDITYDVNYPSLMEGASKAKPKD